MSYVRIFVRYFFLNGSLKMIDCGSGVFSKSESAIDSAIEKLKEYL